MSDGNEGILKSPQKVEETVSSGEGTKKAAAKMEKQYVVFNISKEEFGVSVDNVLEISKIKDITRIPNTSEYVEGAINLRGRIHLVINLAKKLGLAIKEYDNDSRIIIVESEKERAGMLVDSVSEVLKMDKDSIKRSPEIVGHKVNTEYVDGVCVIGQRLIILMDLKKMLNSTDAS